MTTGLTYAQWRKMLEERRSRREAMRATVDQILAGTPRKHVASVEVLSKAYAEQGDALVPLENTLSHFIAKTEALDPGLAVPNDKILQLGEFVDSDRRYGQLGAALIREMQVATQAVQEDRAAELEGLEAALDAAVAAARASK